MGISFYEKINLMECKECIENFLVYNVSTIIAGIKPASTVTFKKTGENLYDKWITYGREFIRNIDLDFIELRDCDDAVIVMIFNEKALESRLFKEEENKLLVGLGYSKDGGVWDYLIKLKDRYDLYNCPHELGVFLGIPIKDVKDFMNCTEKKCLMCGYWKVYNDQKKSQIIFNQYNRIRENTLQQILTDRKLSDLVFDLKKEVICSN